jgi:hypothetical protein
MGGDYFSQSAKKRWLNVGKKLPLAAFARAL